MLCLTEEGTVLNFCHCFGVDGNLTISECDEHKVGVLDRCFFPFQSCLL